MFNKRHILLVKIVILLLVVFVACSPESRLEEVVVTREVLVTVDATPVVVTSPPETEIVVVTATPEPEPEPSPEPKALTICTLEPDTLYYNGPSTLSAMNVFHAIYTNDYTQLSFEYQAEGLEKLPNLADGDAVVNEVIVRSGDTVVNVNGDVVVLADGVNIVNMAGETVTFAGEPISMPQMVVDFTMKQRFWSDGTPVTAADSVYSFDLQANPDTPNHNALMADRTARYEATDELSTRWTGVPGFLDSTFFTNFWKPLPQHAWSQFSATDLVEAIESTRRPIGDGPFMIEEWKVGDYIHLVPNPFYYRADEGLPYLDSVTYKFIADDNQLLAQLIAGECDIASHGRIDAEQSPFLLEAEASGILVPHYQIGTRFDHIDFGINSYGDYGDGIGRPDWFEDVRVRQAITMCTDRQRMVDEIFFGRSEVIHSYIPSIHPLFPDGLTQWPYDVDQANALLDATGFLDSDGDGWREDQATGVPFQVTLDGMIRSESRRQAMEIFKENMMTCGIDVELRYRPANELFADEGVLFGRQFDLGEFAWLTGADPACGLFTTDSITGPLEEGFGGWGSANNLGWSHEAFDAACNRATGSLPGTADYIEGHKEALRIFSQEVPLIPLFLNTKVSASRPGVLNYGLDPTQNSDLYNIYEFDIE